MSLPHPGMDFVPFDVLTAGELDNIVANVEALASGSGQDDGSITSAKLSVAAGEPGGPWQSYAPTNITGFSSSPAGGVYRYQKVGKTVRLFIRQPTDGTSNSTGFTITLPFTAATVTDAEWQAPAQIRNNGTTPSTPGLLVIASAGTTVGVFTSYSGGTFTASGAKRVASGIITYEAA